MNTLPYVSDKTSAFYRRVLIISYEKKFRKKEQNRSLYRELLVQLEGIFLWMLEGLKRLNKNGYVTEAKEMVDLVEEYKMDNKPVRSFVEDNLERQKDNIISKSQKGRMPASIQEKSMENNKIPFSILAIVFIMLTFFYIKFVRY